MTEAAGHVSNVFVLASAWAERHDAIVAATPARSLEVVEARLRRIGIRRGMTQGGWEKPPLNHPAYQKDGFCDQLLRP